MAWHEYSKDARYAILMRIETASSRVADILREKAPDGDVDAARFNGSVLREVCDALNDCCVFDTVEEVDEARQAAQIYARRYPKGMSSRNVMNYAESYIQHAHRMMYSDEFDLNYMSKH